MRIHDYIKLVEDEVAAVQQPETPQVPPQEVQAVQQLINTIDPSKENTDSLIKKLTGWMSAHPLIDVITDIIPQTRMVKAVAGAVDALANNNPRDAALSLGSVLTGRTAQTAVRAANLAATAYDIKQALNPPAPAAAAAPAPQASESLNRIRTLAGL